MLYRRLILPLLLACLAACYDVPVSDEDSNRQACSGMYGGDNAYVNVTFDSGSQGQVAMAIYEWNDVRYLGKVTSQDDWSLPKTYICTTDAVRGRYCTAAQLGKFIVDLPPNVRMNDTSIWTARVGFRNNTGTTSSFWDNPEGNPKLSPEDEKYTSPWRRDEQAARNTYDPSIHWYAQPIHYPVPRTGYYCVAIIPVTVVDVASKRATTDVPFHPTYTGTVHFHNTFKGQLPASEYPKINFFLFLMLAYVGFGVGWAWLCYKHLADLLPIQYYLSSLFGAVILEQLASWGYYRYLNAHGKGAASTAFLVVVTILDAGCNALSFFLLLIVALGLSVVRTSLGGTMTRCYILAVLHFVFAVIYAIGLVYLELESAAALVVLLFVIPLAFTLSGFLLWIMHALNGTIAELEARKQRYKLSMFVSLRRILFAACVVIIGFFVFSTVSFSNRLSEDFAPNSWTYRWWLLDGYLSLLYLAVFVSTCWLWRPTGSNRRLAMSDEIAQDEEDAEDYDLEALERRGHGQPDDIDDATGLPRRPRRDSLDEDGLVFEIGDEHDSDDEGRRSSGPTSSGGHRPLRRLSGDALGDSREREGLMSGGGRVKERTD